MTEQERPRTEAMTTDDAVDRTEGRQQAVREWTPIRKELYETLAGCHYYAGNGHKNADPTCSTCRLLAPYIEEVNAPYERGVAGLNASEAEGRQQAVDIAAAALHRWKHPTFWMGEGRCRCREDAEMGLRLLDDDRVAGLNASESPPQQDWPKFQPGTACPECGARMHGYPCIHHKDGCPILEGKWGNASESGHD